MVIAKRKFKPQMNNTSTIKNNMDYNWAPGPEPPNNQDIGVPKAVFVPHSNSLPFEERRVTLEQPVKIGRNVYRATPSPTNTIFECRVLSRHHATLYYDKGHFYLVDNQSSNGTFINNNRCSISKEQEPHEVFSGDVVQFGIPVVENATNSEKNTFPPVVALLKLFHPDGKEAKLSFNPTMTTPLHLKELYQLNNFVQEAIQREASLEGRLRALRECVQRTQAEARASWELFVGEQRLLMRVHTLETMLAAGKHPEATHVAQLLNDKRNYQEVATESLRAAHEQRLALEESLERRGRETAALLDHNAALRLAAKNALAELQKLAARCERKMCAARLAIAAAEERELAARNHLPLAYSVQNGEAKMLVLSTDSNKLAEAKRTGSLEDAVRALPDYIKMLLPQHLLNKVGIKAISAEGKSAKEFELILKKNNIYDAENKEKEEASDGEGGEDGGSGGEKTGEPECCTDDEKQSRLNHEPEHEGSSRCPIDGELLPDNNANSTYTEPDTEDSPTKGGVEYANILRVMAGLNEEIRALRERLAATGAEAEQLRAVRDELLAARAEPDAPPQDDDLHAYRAKVEDLQVGATYMNEEIRALRERLAATGAEAEQLRAVRDELLAARAEPDAPPQDDDLHAYRAKVEDLQVGATYMNEEIRALRERLAATGAEAEQLRAVRDELLAARAEPDAPPQDDDLHAYRAKVEDLQVGATYMNEEIRALRERLAATGAEAEQLRAVRDELLAARAEPDAPPQDDDLHAYRAKVEDLQVGATYMNEEIRALRERLAATGAEAEQLRAVRDELLAARAEPDAPPQDDDLHAYRAKVEDLQVGATYMNEEIRALRERLAATGAEAEQLRAVRDELLAARAEPDAPPQDDDLHAYRAKVEDLQVGATYMNEEIRALRERLAATGAEAEQLRAVRDELLAARAEPDAPPQDDDLHAYRAKVEDLQVGATYMNEEIRALRERLAATGAEAEQLRAVRDELLAARAEPDAPPQDDDLHAYRAKVEDLQVGATYMNEEIRALRERLAATGAEAEQLRAVRDELLAARAEPDAPPQDDDLHAYRAKVEDLQVGATYMNEEIRALRERLAATGAEAEQLRAVRDELLAARAEPDAPPQDDDLHAYRAKVEDLQVGATYMNEEIRALRERLAATGAEAEQLRAVRDELLAARAEPDAPPQDDDLHAYRAKVEDLQVGATYMNEEIRALRERLAATGAEAEQLRAVRDELLAARAEPDAPPQDDDLHAYRAKVEDLQVGATYMNEEIRALRERLAATGAEAEQLRAVRDELLAARAESDAPPQDDDLHAYRAKVEDLQVGATYMNEEIRALRERLAATGAEAEQLRAVRDELLAARAEPDAPPQDDDLHAYRAKVEDLQVGATYMNEEIRALRERLAATGAEAEQLRAVRDELLAARAEPDAPPQDDDLHAYRAKVEDLQVGATYMNEEIRALRERLAATGAEAEQLRAVRDELLAARAEPDAPPQDDDLHAYRAKVEDLQAQLKRSSAVEEANLAEIQRLASSAAWMQAELAFRPTRAYVDDLTADVAALRADLQARDAQLDRLQPHPDAAPPVATADKAVDTSEPVEDLAVDESADARKISADIDEMFRLDYDDDDTDSVATEIDTCREPEPEAEVPMCQQLEEEARLTGALANGSLHALQEELVRAKESWAEVCAERARLATQLAELQPKPRSATTHALALLVPLLAVMLYVLLPYLS